MAKTPFQICFLFAIFVSSLPSPIILLQDGGKEPPLDLKKREIIIENDEEERPINLNDEDF